MGRGRREKGSQGFRGRVCGRMSWEGGKEQRVTEEEGAACWGLRAPHAPQLLVRALARSRSAGPPHLVPKSDEPKQRIGWQCFQAG